MPETWAVLPCDSISPCLPLENVDSTFPLLDPLKLPIALRKELLAPGIRLGPEEALPTLLPRLSHFLLDSPCSSYVGPSFCLYSFLFPGVFIVFPWPGYLFSLHRLTITHPLYLRFSRCF